MQPSFQNGDEQVTGDGGSDIFVPGDLGEGQHEELFVSGQLTDAKITAATGDTLVELVLGKEVEELGDSDSTLRSARIPAAKTT